MRDRYRAYIVDDEHIARFNLIKKLEDFEEIEIVGEANCIAEAQIGIEDLKPDILFLDIQLNDGTGFDLLNMISFKGKVIFITAFDEYAFRAFEINALDYLLKPISSSNLKKAINKINPENIPSNTASSIKLKVDDRLLITVGSAIHFIEISTINTISSSGDYTIVKTNNSKEYLVAKTMMEWEDRLPSQRFCRINRGLIVNFEQIEKTEKLFSNTALVYIRGYPDPFKLSRSYFRRIKSYYK
ncbi:LytR/AlgR family response regulator transcription factor [Bacteroidota bacterium]